MGAGAANLTEPLRELASEALREPPRGETLALGLSECGARGRPGKSKDKAT